MDAESLQWESEMDWKAFLQLRSQSLDEFDMTGEAKFGKCHFQAGA
jgi:hypothetical protein